MSSRRRLWTAVRTRRAVQVFFLFVFFALILLVPPRPGEELNGAAELPLLVDPLVLAVTALAAHAVRISALLALGTVALTLVFGRVFCGWICPMGTLQAAAGRVFRGRKGRRHDPWSRWQLAKYYVLAALLVGAIFGLHWVCVFDPLVWLTRTTTTAILPAAQWAVEEGSTAIYRADPQLGSFKITAITEPVYGYLRERIFTVPGQAFLGGGLILGLFVASLAANALKPRFWCRYLCPLGALLGLLSWRPLMRRKTQTASCNHCDLCGMACSGAAAAAPGDAWKSAECFGCLNCTDACRRESLQFAVTAPWHRQPSEQPVDLSKRGLLVAAVGGLSALAVARITPQARGKVYHAALIRPPGSRAEREFLQRCTSCGLCMKVCPTGGLQPTLLEAGLEGLWSPRLVPQIGYCDYMCNLCGQVCPTEAIVALEVEEKHATKIGLASFDVTRCIPYAYGRDCMVCEEHCPIPDKAIYSVDVEIVGRDGQKKTIKQPRVDPEKCIGCGVCENVCPFEDRAGIRVTSANESRHPTDDRRPLGNQPILPENPDDPYA